jgi:hypothetical protein
MCPKEYQGMLPLSKIGLPIRKVKAGIITINVADYNIQCFSVWEINIRSESIIGNKVTIWAIVDVFSYESRIRIFTTRSVLNV